MKKWEKWDCCIYKGKGPAGEVTAMFDKNTGFLAGAEIPTPLGKAEIKLAESNISGL